MLFYLTEGRIKPDVTSVGESITSANSLGAHGDDSCPIGTCATLKRVVWYFEEGDVVL